MPAPTCCHQNPTCRNLWDISRGCSTWKSTCMITDKMVNKNPPNSCSRCATWLFSPNIVRDVCCARSVLILVSLLLISDVLWWNNSLYSWMKTLLLKYNRSRANPRSVVPSNLCHFIYSSCLCDRERAGNGIAILLWNRPDSVVIIISVVFPFGLK